MKLLISPLQRMIMGLLPPWGPVGINPIKSAALNAHQFLLRQNFSGKPGLVTAIDLVNYWQEVFEANRIPEAQESSEYIVSYVLGAKTFHSLSASSISTPLTAEQQEQVQQLSAKRLQRMPVQYVLGEWDFQDLTLKMRPPVFIPRPETEDLISLVLEEASRKNKSCLDNAVHQCPPTTPLHVILEIGCGSGAIALSLLRKLPQSQVIAVDKEVAAVNLTRENAQRFQLQHRLRLFHHDVSSSSWEELLPWGPVDIIVSNPPYVFHEDMAHLAAEILRYENLDALDGGNDGMRVIKRILELAPCILKNYGSVFLEVDPRHPEMVENWLQSRPDLFLSLCATHKDFCGKSPVFYYPTYSAHNCGLKLMDFCNAASLHKEMDALVETGLKLHESGFSSPASTTKSLMLPWTVIKSPAVLGRVQAESAAANSSSRNCGCGSWRKLPGILSALPRRAKELAP